MVVVGNNKSTYKQVIKAACDYEIVKLDPSAKKEVSLIRAGVEKLIEENKVMYGITTGFGAFKNKVISGEDIKVLQENLILSHAVGVGEPFKEEIVRVMMFLMANYLSKAHSGVRVVVIETLLEMLNKKVHPLIPQKGSVGSSGDLAPSAHLILVLLGKGEALYNGIKMSGAQAMKEAKITPVKLEAKEGLALINNTTCMTANAVIAINEVNKIIDSIDTIASLSLQGLRGTSKAFDKRIHDLKPHEGQVEVAKRMRELLKGSTMVDNTKVQDQYSLRCIPQIHGGVREAVKYVEHVINVEINSVTDNPLIFKTKNGVEVISGGNFHGEPVAIALDTLGIAVSELANVSDRRIASMLDVANSNGLPAFLTENGGLNSGMMILQYTTASLVSENKVLAHPASVDSIPTSANVEDLVSMGTISARKAISIVENVKYTISIELLVACQAIEFRLKQGFSLSPSTLKVFKKLRKIVPKIEVDQVYYGYINDIYNNIYNIVL